MIDRKIIGITASCFDLCHAGHLEMLKYCKEHCNYLIVLLQTDPSLDRSQKRKPIESTFERYLRLKNCKWVDEIIPYDTEEDLLNALKILQYDIRFLGEEYRDKPFTGRDIPGHFQKCRFNPRNHSFSSTNLIERLKEEKTYE